MTISRKVICLLTALLCLVFLFACDYEYDLYHENIREETEVVGIDLIQYYGQNEGNDISGDPVFDAEKLEVLKTLKPVDLDPFLDELSGIGGLSGKFEQVMDSPNGKGIRITYVDGGFTLITVAKANEKDSIFFGNFDSCNEVERYYGISWQEMIDDFRALVGEYFSVEIQYGELDSIENDRMQ